MVPDLGITASVGSVADAYDNAMAETFVASLKRELVQGRTFATRFEAEIAIFEYLGWFNHRRLHSELDYVPPAEFEAAHHTNNYALITWPPASIKTGAPQALAPLGRRACGQG